MIARIWKEDAQGREIPGTLRVREVAFLPASSSDEGPIPTPRQLRPYVRQSEPIYVKIRKRSRPMRRKSGNLE